jgi:hypothetical protein
VILTDASLRPHLYQLLALQFPNLSVLSYQELSQLPGGVEVIATIPDPEPASQQRPNPASQDLVLLYAVFSLATRYP